MRAAREAMCARFADRFAPIAREASERASIRAGEARARAVHRDGDLAELFVRFRIAVGVGDPVEREHAVERRLERARREPVEHEARRGVELRRIAADALVLVAVHAQPLAEHREQREGRLFGGERAVFDHDAAERERIGQLRQQRARDGVERDPRARAARDLAHARGETFSLRRRSRRAAGPSRRTTLTAPPR